MFIFYCISKTYTLARNLLALSYIKGLNAVKKEYEYKRTDINIYSNAGCKRI